MPRRQASTATTRVRVVVELNAMARDRLIAAEDRPPVVECTVNLVDEVERAPAPTPGLATCSGLAGLDQGAVGVSWASMPVDGVVVRVSVVAPVRVGESFHHSRTWEDVVKRTS